MVAQKFKKMCDRHNKKNIIKNIANGVMNIFIYHIEVKLGIGGIFLITKKTIGKKILILLKMLV